MSENETDEGPEEEWGLRYCPNCGERWQTPFDRLEFEYVEDVATGVVKPKVRCSHGPVETSAGDWGKWS